ncbi:hypothetical protein D3C86_2128040 [compost metagenome]
MAIAFSASGDSVLPPITKISSAASTSPIKAPIGAYFKAPERNSAKSMSSIMTTNRNSTATAPT